MSDQPQPAAAKSLPWRCQCPHLCGGDDDPCWSDVTQEDFLCDHCRAVCAKFTAALRAVGR